jgi:D-amino-acid dehydrogenase
MKIVVLGAGLMGVASAYYLWRDGHDVTVLERNTEPACETSYANACLVSASRALPWPTPSAYKTIWRAITDVSAPMRITEFFDPALWAWGREFLSYANAADYERLSRAKLGFAAFCRDELKQVLGQTKVECGYRSDGLVYVCRSEQSLSAARERSAFVARFGSALTVIDRSAAIKLEPALSNSEIVGASFAPHDGQGDSRVFTRALAEWLRARGVKFEYGQTVVGVAAAGARVQSVQTTDSFFDCDAVVAALGVASASFAQLIGQRVRIYPVKGFSMTVPVKDAGRAPHRGGICEDTLIAYCPVESGRAMRITTGAWFSGDDTRYCAEDFVPHRQNFESLYPGALAWDDVSGTELWSCLRPMTPSSLPILQQLGYENLFFNCGQGHIGWTMSCGSARVISDVIAKRAPSFGLSNMQRAG